MGLTFSNYNNKIHTVLLYKYQILCLFEIVSQTDLILIFMNEF